MNILIWSVLVVASAVLYRMGGSDKYDTKWRDLGVPLCSVLALTVLSYWHWVLCIYYLLLFGSLTTYWKKQGTDADWWNWSLTGFFYGLSVAPYVFVSGHWLGFGLYVAFVTIAVTLWSELIKNSVWEENGRGAIIVLGLPLLLI